MDGHSVIEAKCPETNMSPKHMWGFRSILRDATKFDETIVIKDIPCLYLQILWKMPEGPMRIVSLL